MSLSFLRHARPYEATGDLQNAVRYYERFLAAWADPEPDLQHYADEARQALARVRERR